MVMTMNTSASFSTCDFCDAYKADDSGDFRVLAPVFKDFGGRTSFHGQVLTVKCYQDNSHVKKAVESDGLGRVLVVDGAGCLQRALLGGNLAAAAARHGWAGVVVYGCVRDLSEFSVLPWHSSPGLEPDANGACRSGSNRRDRVGSRHACAYRGLALCGQRWHGAQSPCPAHFISCQVFS